MQGKSIMTNRFWIKSISLGPRQRESQCWWEQSCFDSLTSIFLEHHLEVSWPVSMGRLPLPILKPSGLLPDNATNALPESFRTKMVFSWLACGNVHLCLPHSTIQLEARHHVVYWKATSQSLQEIVPRLQELSRKGATNVYLHCYITVRFIIFIVTIYVKEVASKLWVDVEFLPTQEISQNFQSWYVKCLPVRYESAGFNPQSRLKNFIILTGVIALAFAGQNHPQRKFAMSGNHLRHVDKRLRCQEIWVPTADWCAVCSLDKVILILKVFWTGLNNFSPRPAAPHLAPHLSPNALILQVRLLEGALGAAEFGIGLKN